MADFQFLIVEGNTAQKNAEIRAQGGRVYAEVYRAVLRAIAPGAHCQVLSPCEEDPSGLAARIDLAGVDGAVWTGSSLNAYSPIPEVTGQVALFEQLFDARVPIFGSCWGLQVMATALGGKVRRNPWGREIGIARDIALTAEGAAHPMYAGKPGRFEAIAMHVDDVERLPAGCSVLAGNAASAVQAAVLDDGERSFWGVQYHPEFDLRVLALGMRRVAPDLIAEGLFETPAALDAVCDGLIRIDADPTGSRSACSALGIGDSVLNPATRRLEIANWIDQVVRPRAAARGDTPAEQAAS
jgi:GMP synthase (glutamine-hydrolysing)